MTANNVLHAPLIIDVAGTELNAADRRRLAHPLVGGVIHFARNWQDRAQMSALNAEIKALRPDILICVDHEGGRVQRFRSDGFTRLPSMRVLGELWMSEPCAPPRLQSPAAMCLRASSAPAASTSVSRPCSIWITAKAA